MQRPLAFYTDNLMTKLQEGNKTRWFLEQERSTAGTFGSKDLLECSWQTLIKKMNEDYNDCLAKCSCIIDKPLNSAQALIKHIERRHYNEGTVLVDQFQITIINTE